eukprot:TRINITY_DN5957_c0_g3_i1.p1 TRINITY_DN5957_c0_g3~~TRINITY_DN5957_c0_g3_i1.p1  ORF type:complete len:918 (+),score=203.90 TRINITY_DN5957_c0_g3_i1:31-2784(+)
MANFEESQPLSGVPTLVVSNIDTQLQTMRQRRQSRAHSFLSKSPYIEMNKVKQALETSQDNVVKSVEMGQQLLEELDRKNETIKKLEGEAKERDVMVFELKGVVSQLQKEVKQKDTVVAALMSELDEMKAQRKLDEIHHQQQEDSGLTHADRSATLGDLKEEAREAAAHFAEYERMQRELHLLQDAEYELNENLELERQKTTGLEEMLQLMEETGQHATEVHRLEMQALSEKYASYRASAKARQHRYLVSLEQARMELHEHLLLATQQATDTREEIRTLSIALDTVIGNLYTNFIRSETEMRQAQENFEAQLHLSLSERRVDAGKLTRKLLEERREKLAVGVLCSERIEHERALLQLQQEVEAQRALLKAKDEDFCRTLARQQAAWEKQLREQTINFERLIYEENAIRHIHADTWSESSALLSCWAKDHAALTNCIAAERRGRVADRRTWEEERQLLVSRAEKLKDSLDRERLTTAEVLSRHRSETAGNAQRAALHEIENMEAAARTDLALLQAQDRLLVSERRRMQIATDLTARKFSADLELNTVKADLETVRRALAAEREMNVTLGSKHAHAEAELRRLESESRRLATLEREIGLRDIQISQLRNEAETAEREKKALSHRIEQLQVRECGHLEALARAQDDLRALRTANELALQNDRSVEATLAREAQEGKEKFMTLSRELHELRAKLSSYEAERSTLHKTIENLHEQISTLRQDLNRDRGHWEKRVSKQSEEYAAVRKERDAAHSEVAELKNALKRLEAERDTLLENVQSRKQHIDAWQEERLKSNEKHAHFCKALEQRHTAELHVLKSQLQDLLEEARAKEAERDQLCGELQQSQIRQRALEEAFIALHQQQRQWTGEKRLLERQLVASAEQSLQDKPPAMGRKLLDDVLSHNTKVVQNMCQLYKQECNSWDL